MYAYINKWVPIKIYREIKRGKHAGQLEVQDNRGKKYYVYPKSIKGIGLNATRLDDKDKANSKP